MNKVYAFAGPPASGKTTTIQKVKHILSIPDDRIFDDIYAISDWGEKAKSKLAEGDIIIADIMFSDPTQRDAINCLFKEVIWTFMEKNLEQCLINAMFRCVFMIPQTYASGRRNLRREFELIKKLTEVYNPPFKSVPVPKCPDLNLGQHAAQLNQ